MSSDEKQPDVFFLPEQELTLESLQVEGWILDVGGGGEGVIGQLEGSSVVAIDRRADELREALEASGDEGRCLRIVMDARKLQFLDACFPAATCFFSLMYMTAEEHVQVLKEIHRVLKQGGELFVWDFDFPPRGKHLEPIAAYRLHVHLPEKSIHTGYGCRWPEQGRDLAYYAGLLKKCGFSTSHSICENAILTLRGCKGA